MSLTSNTSPETTPGSLLMTCRVLSRGPDGSSIESRALLDSASSISFVSERLAQAVCLQRFRRDAKIHGVEGLSHDSHSQSFTNLVISPMQESTKEINVKAVIVPRVSVIYPVNLFRSCKADWSHLADLTLADPYFGRPGKIDLLLGVEVFSAVVRQGRRSGMPGSPSAFETDFGWVLAGETSMHFSHLSLLTHHTTISSSDDLLRKFWEIEEQPSEYSSLSPEERSVVEQFQKHHSRTSDDRFIVPLPKKPQTKPLGESRLQAVRRHKSLERALQARRQGGSRGFARTPLLASKRFYLHC